MNNMSDKTKSKRINEFYINTYNQEAKSISGAIHTLKKSRSPKMSVKYSEVVGCPTPPSVKNKK